MISKDEAKKGLEMTGTESTLRGTREATPTRGAGPSLCSGAVNGAQDAVEEALGNFRLSVHAWSEAAKRPIALEAATRPHSMAWRRTLAWAMGVVLAAGAASGGLYERHHRQAMAEQARERQLQLEQREAAQRAAEMDQLLANVDRDVSQEVPDALEPLARMMTDDGGSKKE